MKSYVNKENSKFSKFTFSIDVDTELEASILFSIFGRSDVVKFIHDKCGTINLSEIRANLEAGSNIKLRYIK